MKFSCPCVNCLNERKLNATQVRKHLICDGFLRSYTIWTWHSVLINFPIVSRTKHVVDSTMEERQEERVEEDNMIRDVGTKAFAQAHVYETMSVNAETPLYVSPTKLMRINVLQNCSCS